MCDSRREKALLQCSDGENCSCLTRRSSLHAALGLMSDIIFLSGSFFLYAYRHFSCKEGSAGLVMPQDVPKASWSRTFSYPHHLARGADELEDSWRHELPRSRQTWNRSPVRESSATHDGDRTGWKCLVSSHRTAESGVLPFETWSTRLVNADASTSKYKQCTGLNLLNILSLPTRLEGAPR